MLKSRNIHERSSIIPIYYEISASNKECISPKARGEYSSKENFFDPSKSSPPNLFMIKLNRRLVTYNSFISLYDGINEDNFKRE